MAVVYGGDDRWYGNVFAPRTTDPAPYARYGTADYNGAPSSLAEYLQRVKSMGVGDVEHYEAHPQPVYTRDNAYFGGAQPFDKEEHPLCKPESLPFQIFDDGQTVWLKLDVMPELAALPRLAVTTQTLPQARIVQQDFENPDGTPLCVTGEFLSRLTPGTNCIPVWTR